AVRAVAAESGSTPTAVALAWLLAQPAMTAPIIGANSVGQLQESLAAGDLVLTAEQLATLNAASKWQGGESD
ncbi:MAG: aldo/keto reductase, partial [Caldilineaceae bacterium]|nr:aldo/keto reductase [Caldilineaceae bacterium]